MIHLCGRSGTISCDGGSFIGLRYGGRFPNSRGGARGLKGYSGHICIGLRGFPHEKVQCFLNLLSPLRPGRCRACGQSRTCGSIVWRRSVLVSPVQKAILRRECQYRGKETLTRTAGFVDQPYYLPSISCRGRHLYGKIERRIDS